jgi:hypothetical protein
MSGHEDNTCPKCSEPIDEKDPGTCGSCGAKCPMAKDSE